MALFGDDAHGDLFAAEAQRRVLGEEDHANPVVTGGGQVDAVFGGDAREKAVRHLEQDARTVTRFGIGPRGTAMVEAFEYFERLFDDAMRRNAVEVHDRAKPTGVVLKLAIVETADVFPCLHMRQST